MSRYWWETTTSSGLPRFCVFATQSNKRLHRHINIVELKDDATEIPTQYRSKQIKKVLLRTVPLDLTSSSWGSKGVKIWGRAERVLERLNAMPLSVMAVEHDKDGIQNIFDKLWLEDVESNPDS